MKRGIELSVNFIVVFVIAIIILFFGIKLVYDIMSSGKEIELALTEDVIRKLEILASQGERISIAFNSETIYPGKHHTFGLGILNINATHKYFAIGVEKGNAYDKDNNPIENNLQFLLNNKAFIELDELRKIPIGVKVPGATRSGSYIINVYVCHDDAEIDYSCTHDSLDYFYDKDNPVRKIYVDVP